MSSPTRILIIGNGFGGIYALKNLHKYFCGNSQVKISLIGEKNYFLFTPLLHEVATGGIKPENIIEPIRKILGCCIDKFYLGKAEKINTVDKIVEVGNEKIEYDYLILATGAQTNFYNILGAEKYSLPLKTLEDAIKIKNTSILQLERASLISDRNERKAKLAFAIVGGGATGVEIAAELEEFVKETFSHYYSKEVIEDVSITLIQRDAELLTQFNKKLRNKSLTVLRKKGITVLLNEAVKEVRESEIVLSSGKTIPATTVIWVAGIKPAELKFDKTVLRSQSGQLVVNEYLELEEHNNIYAIGDTAFSVDKEKNNPLPSLAQVAIKQASHVAKNIKLKTENKKLKSFKYKSSGSLVSLGQWMALGEIFNFAFSGAVIWWLWRTVYLFKLISWKKKLNVATDWTINLFVPRDISQF